MARIKPRWIVLGVLLVLIAAAWWAITRMNQKHCADWPEIFQEITRVLQLLKRHKS